MAVNCSLDTLLSNSRCYLEECASDQEREAIQIFAMMQNLNASGGTDYTGALNSLLNAAKTWKLSATQREAIRTYYSLINATNNGAEINTNIDNLKAQTKCIQCIGTEDRRNIILFLRCALNNAGKP